VKMSLVTPACAGGAASQHDEGCGSAAALSGKPPAYRGSQKQFGRLCLQIGIEGRAHRETLRFDGKPEAFRDVLRQSCQDITQQQPPVLTAPSRWPNMLASHLGVLVKINTFCAELLMKRFQLLLFVWLGVLTLSNSAPAQSGRVKDAADPAPTGEANKPNAAKPDLNDSRPSSKSARCPMTQGSRKRSSRSSATWRSGTRRF
jgi:hypothetical protein